MVRRALPHLLGAGVPSLALPQRLHETALSDAGLPRDMDDAAVAAHRLPPGVREPLELAIAPDHRGHPARTRDLEAADRARGAQGAIHADGTRHPLQRLLPQRLGLEVALDQVARVRADDNRSRLGDRLKSCSDVRGLPDDVVLRARVAGAHLPHHHDPGVEPDPRLQRDVEPLAEVLVDRHELVDDSEAGVHCPLCIVLVRARVAEVGDHTVAEILRRVAVEAVDGTRAGVLVRAEDLAPVLGVERPGERRGLDEVAEEHGHVPSLPGAGHPRRRGRDRPVLQAATAAAAESQSGRALQTAVTAPHFGCATTLSCRQGKHNPAGCRYSRACVSCSSSQASIQSSSSACPASIPDRRSQIRPSLKETTSDTSASSGIGRA